MSEPITIIGAETVVSGNLEGDEDLTVEGKVEGSISLSKTLSVEVGGVVRADINVRNAVISGVLVGNIVAQESVHITEQGRVVGDIAAPRVILVDGSSFKGNIDMGDFALDKDVMEAAASAPRRPAKSAPVIRTRSHEPVRTHEAPARHEAPATHEEEDREPEVKAAPSPAPIRRPIPVRPVVATTPAAAAPAAPAASSSSSILKRPLPQKARVSRTPPAPMVRAIGKKKAKKK
jgi:cytoskeletal protein CcmA (bactofilin family)